MGAHIFLVLGALLLLYVDTVSSQVTGLRMGFYNNKCPNAESIARQTLQQNLVFDPTAPAALLRLSFHDCQVQGCDASILLQSSANITAETTSERNFKVRRLDFIDRIKAALENTCPKTVSCADIIIMAARDAIILSGGPSIPVPTGRRDGVTASKMAADNDLPPATVTVDDFLKIFGQIGLNTEDSVAILGGHSLGVAHCPSFLNRLFPEADPAMSMLQNRLLSIVCQLPDQLKNLKFAGNDLTNFIFDNQYYRDLQGRRGLMTIDSELANDPRTSPFVARFASDQNYFFQRFSAAFVQLTSYNVLTGQNGQIRENCRLVNKKV